MPEEQPIPVNDIPVPPPGQDVAALRRKKARRRLVMLLILAVGLFGAGWYINKTASLSFEKIISLGSSVEQVAKNELSGAVSTTTPLRSLTSPKNGSALTIKGIIVQTNLQRAASSVSPLAENDQLDAVALLRLDDMFQNQYFAHVSPASSSALTVADAVGYNHIALGENLAMGFFKGDKGVVDAWMGSPGHRENILNPHYTQIGVAARIGTFEGKQTWIAVQVFGRPASDCVAPDPAEKADIDALVASTTAMKAEIDEQQVSIAAMQPQSGPDYNTRVAGFNDLVEGYNALALKLKNEVTDYNAKVVAYNACLQQ